MGFKGVAREPWSSPIPLEEILRDIDQPHGMIVKWRKDRAIKVEGDLIVKVEFLWAGRNWLLMAKSLWAKDRLRRQWRASLRAKERGIPIPEPLALLEQRWGRLLLKSLLVSRYERKYSTLSQYLREKVVQEGWVAQKGKSHLQRLASSVLQMHEKGMIHRDLKGSNILVRENEEAWNFLFTDLKATSFHDEQLARNGTRRRRMVKKDILRLLATLRAFFAPSERALFLRTYLSLGEDGAQPIIACWEQESLRLFPSNPRVP